MDYKLTGSKIKENEYEFLDRPELITLVKDLYSQITILRSDKATGAAVSRLLARLSFAAAVFLIPARYRIVLSSRPVPPVYKDYTDILLFASDIAVLGVTCFWLLSLILEPDRASTRLTAKPLFLTVPLAGIVLLSGISATFSIDPTLSIYHTIRLVALFLVYLYAIQDISNVRWVLLPAGISILLQSTVSVLQILNQSSLGLTAIGELQLNPDWRGVSIVWAEGIRSLRAYGLSDHPNILGGCLASALLVSLLWYLTIKEEKPNSWGMPVIASLIFLGGTALFFTYSRAAWLAFTTGILLVFLLLIRFRARSEWTGTLGLLFGGLVICLPFIWNNLAYLSTRLNYQGSFASVGNEFRAINERRLLNTSANEIFSKNAITGVGLGAYPQALLAEQPEFPIDYQPAHTAIIAAAADIGLLGASVFAIALITPWIALGTAWWRGNHRIFSLPLIVLSGLLLTLTVIGAFDYYTWLLAPGRLWQWLAWGLWGAAYQSAHQGENNA